jgi:hypothetical protein
MSKHNEAQIHVRTAAGKFRPGTTTPPPAEAEPTKLSPNEQSFLARGSKPDPTPGEMTAADANGLEAADVVEVVSGSMHTDEGDSIDPSSQS